MHGVMARPHTNRAPYLQDLVGGAAHARPPGHGASLDPLQLAQQRLVAGRRRGWAVCQAAALQRAVDAGAGADAVEERRRAAVGPGPATAVMPAL